jgi:hypothetical protein
MCHPSKQKFHNVIRVIQKIRKTQHHQNPEFGHKQGEIFIKKNLQKMYISVQPRVKLRKPSILMVI